MAIQSFSDPEAEEFFVTGRLRKGVLCKNLSRVARRKLDMLHYAANLGDLKSPPGNRLEALKGDFAGSYSIRINDQWRVVFLWAEHGPEGVSIRDYHR